MHRRLRSCVRRGGSPRASSPRETILSLRVGDELAQIAKWRTNVAELVTDCCERWDLRAGEPYVPGVCGHVVRVDLADGAPARSEERRVGKWGRCGGARQAYNNGK